MHGPDVDDSPAPAGAVVDGAAVLRRIVDLFGRERSVRAARRERILRPAQAGSALQDGDDAAGVPDERLAAAAFRPPPPELGRVAKAKRGRPLSDEGNAGAGRHCLAPRCLGGPALKAPAGESAGAQGSGAKCPLTAPLARPATRQYSHTPCAQGPSNMTCMAGLGMTRPAAAPGCGAGGLTGTGSSSRGISLDTGGSRVTEPAAVGGHFLMQRGMKCPNLRTHALAAPPGRGRDGRGRGRRPVLAGRRGGAAGAALRGGGGAAAAAACRTQGAEISPGSLPIGAHGP